MNEIEIIIWHELDGVADTTLNNIYRVCSIVEDKMNCKFILEKMNINDFILKMKAGNCYPDLALIPQNMINLADICNFSVVPSNFSHEIDYNIWDSMCYKGKQLGVPYLQGNHAVMYFNRNYIENIDSWLYLCELRNNICKCMINLNECYWILPFCLEKKLEYSPQKLKYLVELINKKIITCALNDREMISDFVNGKVVSIIAGEWIYNYLKEEMQDVVGVTTIPRYFDVDFIGVSSTLGVVFPNNSLEGLKRKYLECFIQTILSKEIQLDFLKEYKRIPVNTSINISSEICENNLKNIYEQMINNCLMVSQVDNLDKLWDSVKTDLDKFMGGTYWRRINENNFVKSSFN